MKKSILIFVMAISCFAQAETSISGKVEVFGERPMSAPLVTVIEGQLVVQSIYELAMSTVILVEENCAELSDGLLVTKKCYLPQQAHNVPFNKKVLVTID